MAAPGTSLRICGECGTLVARRASSCLVCRASALAARDVTTTLGAGWVRITAAFVCRSCGQRSALDGLDVDGTVQCTACGLTQAFDSAAWSQALDFAHGLADLGSGRGPGFGAGPGAIPVAENPFAESGETAATFHFETTGLRTVDGVVRTASIAIDASVAHPLCTTCRAPLVAFANGPELTTRCEGCAAVSHHLLPTPAFPIEPYPVAIIADDARTDGTAVRLETDAGGAVAIRCPSCSANLPASAGVHGSVFECTYCKTVCRIPRATSIALRPAGAPARPFFLAFAGASSLRARIAEQARAVASQREGARALEAAPHSVPTPRQLAMRLVFTLLVLALVGLAYAPRLLSILEAAALGAQGPTKL